MLRIFDLLSKFGWECTQVAEILWLAKDGDYITINTVNRKVVMGTDSALMLSKEEMNLIVQLLNVE